MEILTVEHLSKHYGSIRAVQDLSLSVRQGQILGLLGPNGSGKTTTLGMILGIVRPTSGRYQWFTGETQKSVRRRLGALLETPNFYPYLSAEENLGIIRHIKRSKETSFDRLLRMVNLENRRHSKFETFSLGMKQRLAIAAAMVGDPDVLILDEPTNGLDPQGIADVRNTIIDIAQEGRTIIMASHILMEVEKVCSHVAILKSGQLLAHGPVGTILSKSIVYEIGGNPLEDLVNIVAAMPGVQVVKNVGSYCEVEVDRNLSIAHINQHLIRSDIEVNHLVQKKNRLEDEFLEIIK